MAKYTRETKFGPREFETDGPVTEGELRKMVEDWEWDSEDTQQSYAGDWGHQSVEDGISEPEPEFEPAPLDPQVLLSSPPQIALDAYGSPPKLVDQLTERSLTQAYVPGTDARDGRRGITVIGPSDTSADEWFTRATGRLPARPVVGPDSGFADDPAFHEQVTFPSVDAFPRLFAGAASEALAAFSDGESTSERRLVEARAKLMKRTSDNPEANIMLLSLEEDYNELKEMLSGIGGGGDSIDETEIEDTFSFQIPDGTSTEDIRLMVEQQNVAFVAGKEMMGSFKATMNVLNPELHADATLSPKEFLQEAFLFWASDPIEAALDATWVLPGLDPLTLALKGIKKGGKAGITGLRLLSNANKIRREVRAAYGAEVALNAETAASRAQGAAVQAKQNLGTVQEGATAKALEEIADPPALTSDQPPVIQDQSLIQADVDLGAANVKATMADDAAALAAEQTAEVTARAEAKIAKIGEEITEVRNKNLLEETAPPKRPEEPTLMDSDASPDQAARDATDVNAHDIVHGDGGTRQALDRSNSGANNANSMKNADMEEFSKFVQEGLDLAGDGRVLAEMPPRQKSTFIARDKQLAESGFVVKEVVEEVVDGAGTGRLVETGRLLIDGNEVNPLIDAVLEGGKTPSPLEQLAMGRYWRQLGKEIGESGEAMVRTTEKAVQLGEELIPIRKRAAASEGGTALDPEFRKAQEDLTAVAEYQTKLDGERSAQVENYDRARRGAKEAGSVAGTMLNERKMFIHVDIGEADFLSVATRKNNNKPLSQRKKAKIRNEVQGLQKRIDKANKSLDEAESSLGRAREEATGRLEAGDPAADAAAAQANANKARAKVTKKARTDISKAEGELARAKKAADKAAKKAERLEAQAVAKEQKALARAAKREEAAIARGLKKEEVAAARALKKEEIAKLRAGQKAERAEINQARADQRKAESIAAKEQRSADAAATKLEKQIEKIAKVEERALEKARKAEQRRTDRAKSKHAKDIADQDPAVLEARARVLDAKKKAADAQSAKLIAYDQAAQGPAGIFASTILKAASASTLMTTSAEWSYLGMQFSGGLAWASLLEAGMFAKSGFKGRVPGTTVALTTKEAMKAMFSPSSARSMAARLRSNPRASFYDKIGVSFKTVEDISRMGGDAIEEMMRAYHQIGLFGKESNIPVLRQGRMAMSGMLRRSNNAIALSGNMIRYSLMDIFSSAGFTTVEMERIAHLVNLSTGTFEFRPKALKPGTGLSPGQLSGFAKAERTGIDLASNFLIAPKLYSAVIKRPFVVGAMALSGNAAVRNAALTYMGMHTLRKMSYGIAGYLSARFYDGLSEEESWMRAKLATVPGSPYEGKLTMGDEQWGLDGGTTGTRSSFLPSIGISGQEQLNAIERLNYYLEDPDFDYTKLKLLGDDYFARVAKGLVKYKLHPAYGAAHDIFQGETFYGAELKQEDFKSKQAYWFNRAVLPMIGASVPFTGQSLTMAALGQVEQARGITDPSQSDFIGKNDAHLLKSPAWMFALKTVLEPFGITSSISRHKIDEKKKRKGAAPRVPKARGLGGGLGGGGLGGGL